MQRPMLRGPESTLSSKAPKISENWERKAEVDSIWSSSSGSTNTQQKYELKGTESVEHAWIKNMYGFGVPGGRLQV